MALSCSKSPSRLRAAVPGWGCGLDTHMVQKFGRQDLSEQTRGGATENTFRRKVSTSSRVPRTSHLSSPGPGPPTGATRSYLCPCTKKQWGPHPPERLSRPHKSQVRVRWGQQLPLLGFSSQGDSNHSLAELVLIPIKTQDAVPRAVWVGSCITYPRTYFLSSSGSGTVPGAGSPQKPVHKQPNHCYTKCGR